MKHVSIDSTMYTHNDLRDLLFLKGMKKYEHNKNKILRKHHSDSKMEHGTLVINEGKLKKCQTF